MNENEEFVLSDDDKTRLTTLTTDDLELIDTWLLSQVTCHWQKSAMVVALAIGESDKAERLEDVSDVIFDLRVESLVNRGMLQARGNVRKLRFSEVKLNQEIT